MTSRQILFKQSKELTSLLESVQRSIEIIKDIKDSLPDIDERLRIKEIETERQLETFEKNIKEKKLETILNVATELGKMVISPVDMEDLVNEVKDLRASVAAQVQEKTDLAVDKFKTQLIHEVKIKDLLHEKELAILEIRMKTKDEEIQSLKEKNDFLQQQLQQQPVRNVQYGRQVFPTSVNVNQSSSSSN
jgi:hypothetical protein